MPQLPFVGSESLAAGLTSRHRLRSSFRRLYPDVYLPTDVTDPSLTERIHGAWLWSQRQAVIAGSSAAFLHGARWVDDDSRVELVYRNPRTPTGVVARRDALLDDETMTLGGLEVTTPARTAFDLGRRDKPATALIRMDSLLRATGLSKESVARVATHHKRARGLRQLENVLVLADPGAQSPKETWLRLVLVQAGLPRPQTQIPVRDPDGFPIAYLDMGWPESLVAVEYDGDHHRLDRNQYVRDIRRREMLERMGWIIITVVSEDRAADVVKRARDALGRRSSVR